MDTKETAPRKSKKFLKIALIMLAIVAVLLGTAFFLTALKNAKQVEVQITDSAIQALREPTEAEKLAKAQNEELDRMRTQYQTQGTSSATTALKTQVKSLDTLRTQILKQKITPPSATPHVPKTIEQQNQELDALRATLNK